MTTHPASDVVIDWSYGAPVAYWESLSSASSIWFKVVTPPLRVKVNEFS